MEALDPQAAKPVRAARFYRPELDVLRFVAFLLVFLHHGLASSSPLLTALAGSGAMGLALFFMLSSYLITELLHRERVGTGTNNLKSFYIRRVLRIWPLYFAFILGDFIVERFHDVHAFTPARLAAYLLLAGNWYAGAFGVSTTAIAPLWSISVEEQFYLLWPAVHKYLNRLAIPFSIVMFLLSYAVLYHLCAEHHVHAIWENSFVEFQYFSVGALLAAALHGKAPTFHPFLRVTLFLAGLAFFFTASNSFHIKDYYASPLFSVQAPGYLCAAAGCVLVFLAMLGEPRLARIPGFVYLGKISFGLYVFHFLMLRLSSHVVERLIARAPSLAGSANVLQLLLAFALTVIAAALSYRFFEAPILKFKSRFEYIRTRSV